MFIVFPSMHILSQSTNNNTITNDMIARNSLNFFAFLFAVDIPLEMHSQIPVI